MSVEFADVRSPMPSRQPEPPPPGPAHVSPSPRAPRGVGRYIPPRPLSSKNNPRKFSAQGCGVNDTVCGSP
ncbi:hypothetical protein SLEP1_g51250 [Rubroshorea leprosula]|uniref:Uncharacterized protein n=1 Tax=Rubroshorea leprosula TaxID=152421 RepID=A0AAV5M4Q1_9ROSI|nr:hypothetical protein SLEP1_g51250 [Rubroshorea leprosula]